MFPARRRRPVRNSDKVNLAGAVCVLCLALGVTGAAVAGSGLLLEFEEVAGPGWRAGPGALEVEPLSGGGLRARGELGGLALPAPLDAVAVVRLECPRGEWRDAGFACPNGVLEVVLRDGSRPRVEAGFTVGTQRGRQVVVLEPLALPFGELQGRLRLGRDGWRLALDCRRCSVAALAALVGGSPSPQWPVPSAGEADLELEVDARDGETVALALSASARGVDFSDAEGLRAGEGIGLELTLEARRRGSAIVGPLRIQIGAGAAFWNPVFLDLGTHPLTVAGVASWDRASGHLALDEAALELEGVARAGGGGELAVAGGGLTRVRVRLERQALAPLYQHLLRPFLPGRALGELDVAGALAMELDWTGGAASDARLALDGVALDDRQGRFGVFGLTGTLHWGAGRRPPISELAWTGGQFYRLDVGPGRVEAILEDDGLILSAPLVLPVLGGAVRVEALSATGLVGPHPEWRARGEVEPLDLEELSHRLAWLPLQGELAGTVPEIHYRDSVVSVGGSLEAHAFDGTLTVRGLRLERPFGVAPVLSADVDVDDLSLEALTRAFSFGNIQGRLEGRVHGLVLEDWQPTAFDAAFATPADDDSRRRISQRAVDNLASLGGTGAVLSGTFLRFFRSFSYDRLGLSCRLARGVCQMGGVAPAERGYYIVRGGGLPPRIDVIGFNDRVNWRTLLGRLKAITRSPGPVIR